MKKASLGLGVFTLLAALIAVAGCGPGNTVSGKVEFEDGTPVKEGWVSFGTDEISYPGQITDGRYTVEGVPPGDYNVTVGGVNMSSIKAPSGLTFTVKSGDNSFDITGVTKGGASSSYPGT